MTYSPIDKQKLKVILICHDDDKTQGAAEKVLNELNEVIPSAFDIKESQVIKCVNTTECNIIKKIKNIVDSGSQKKVETIAIFYIGHSVTWKTHDTQKHCYLLTKDTKQNGISLDDMWFNILRESKIIKNIFLYLNVLENETVNKFDVYSCSMGIFCSTLHLNNISDKRFSLFVASEKFDEHIYHFSNDFLRILKNGIENGMETMTLGEIRDSLYSEQSNKYDFFYYPIDNKNFDMMPLIKNKKCPKCNYDILISYHHSLNYATQENPLGKITKLHQNLKDRFKKDRFKKEDYCICMNYELLIDDTYSQDSSKRAINRLLEKVNILCIILTRHYFQSKWCQFVLSQFVEHSRERKGCLKSRNIYVIDIDIPHKQSEKNNTHGNDYKCTLSQIPNNIPILYYQVNENELSEESFLNQLTNDLICRLKSES